MKGFITYYTLEKELAPFDRMIEKEHPEAVYKPLEKLHRYYERGIQKGVNDPESYAVKKLDRKRTGISDQLCHLRFYIEL